MQKPYSHFTKLSAGPGLTPPAPKSPVAKPATGATPSANAGAPAFRSATNTGVYESGANAGTAIPFKAPEYYKRQGVDPRLAAEGQKLEQEYAARFPYGDYTYSNKGWGYQGGNRAQMSQEDIDLRNRFRNYEAQAMGSQAINPNATQATVSGDRGQSPGYFSMLGDSLKRVANRWGGDFQTQYDDPLLDYSSYALEAAPQLAAAALTAGGSAALQGGGEALQGAAQLSRGARLAQTAGKSAPWLTKGFNAAAPAVESVAARVPGLARVAGSAPGRFVGRAMASAGNAAMAPINPLPALSGAMRAGNTWAALPAWMSAAGGLYGAKSNWGNALQDTQNYIADNPSEGLISGTGNALSQMGQSVLAGGGSLDPTAANPLQMGVTAFTSPFQTAHEQGFNDRLNRSLALFSELNPQASEELDAHPAMFQEQSDALRQQYEKDNPGFVSTMARLGNAVSFNPFKAMGAKTYGQKTQASAIGADKAITGFAPQVMQAFQQGQDPLAVPGLMDAIRNAPPQQQQFMAYQLQRLQDQYNAQQPQGFAAGFSSQPQQGMGPTLGAYQ